MSVVAETFRAPVHGTGINIKRCQLPLVFSSGTVFPDVSQSRALMKFSWSCVLPDRHLDCAYLSFISPFALVAMELLVCPSRLPQSHCHFLDRETWFMGQPSCHFAEALFAENFV